MNEACMVCSNIGMIFIGLHTSIWVACGLNMVRCVAIGSAIFVGIMSTVGENSMASYGAEAQIHGLNVTFAAMTAVSLVLLGIGIFGVKKSEK